MGPTASGRRRESCWNGLGEEGSDWALADWRRSRTIQGRELHVCLYISLTKKESDKRPQRAYLSCEDCHSCGDDQSVRIRLTRMQLDPTIFLHCIFALHIASSCTSPSGLMPHATRNQKRCAAKTAAIGATSADKKRATKSIGQCHLAVGTSVFVSRLHSATGRNRRSSHGQVALTYTHTYTIHLHHLKTSLVRCLILHYMYDGPPPKSCHRNSEHA